MEIRPSYGKQIVNALRESGVTVDLNFNFSYLPAHKKDLACRELIGMGEWFPTECIPGAAEFGKNLANLFFADPIFYVAGLRIELINHAKLDKSISLEDSLIHSAELLDCEATARAGLAPRQALLLLFSDPLEFIRQANNALVKYLDDFISNEIEDVLGEVVCH